MVRLFSTASIRMVIINSAVRNTSITKPPPVLTPSLTEFSAWSGPGRIAATKPAAVMPPRNWAGITQTRRTQLKAPDSHKPKAIYPCH